MFWSCVNEVYRAFTDDFMCNLHQKYGSLHRCKPKLQTPISHKGAKNMIFNYKRVSTTDQNTERQLLDIACDRAYIEKISGKNTDRPELQAMLLNIRAGDVVNVHSMDRLARNTKDLLDLVEEITVKGAKVVFHKENLTFAPDRQDPYQKMMMTMLGAVAELERNLILERQREGIALAKLHGKYKGGQPKLTAQQVEEIKALINNRTPIIQIAKQYGISRRTVYNYL